MENEILFKPIITEDIESEPIQNGQFLCDVADQKIYVDLYGERYPLSRTDIKISSDFEIIDGKLYVSERFFGAMKDSINTLMDACDEYESIKEYLGTVNDKIENIHYSEKNGIYPGDHIDYYANGDNSRPGIDNYSYVESETYTFHYDGSSNSVNSDVLKANPFVKEIIIEPGFEYITNFGQCPNLEIIRIPSSIISVNQSAFSGCRNLKIIEISRNGSISDPQTLNSCVEIISNILRYIDYENNKDYIVKINNTILEDVDYTFNRYTGIPNDYFKNWNFLRSITAPSITSIGDRAFEYCSNLVSVTFPETEFSVGVWAFYGCNIKYYSGNLAAYESARNGEVFETLKIYGVSEFSSVYAKNLYITTDVTIFNTSPTCENLYYSGTLSDWLQCSFGNSFSLGDSKLYLDGSLLSSIYFSNQTTTDMAHQGLRDYKYFQNIRVSDDVTVFDTRYLCGTNINIILERKPTISRYIR